MQKGGKGKSEITVMLFANFLTEQQFQRFPHTFLFAM